MESCRAHGALGRRKRMSTAWIRALGATIITVASQDAAATSCDQLWDRYVFGCIPQGSCTAAFHVEQVHAFGTCGRRSHVQAVDPRVAEFLGSVVQAGKTSGAGGVFEVRLEKPHYWAARAGTEDPFDSLKENLSTELFRYNRRKRVELTALTASDVVDLLDERYGMKWLESAPGVATDEALLVKRKHYESAAARELFESTLRWTAYWLSFVVATLAFIHSVHLYFARLYARSASTSKWRFAMPLAIQVTVALLGGIALFGGRFDFWPGSLLLPAAITVLLAETWATYRSRTPRRQGPD
jgi:hypothetical protein